MTIPEFWNGSWNPGWAAPLFNHLWQSTFVALLAWLIALVLRRNPARVRYSIWMLASIKFLVPFALLANIGAHWARPIPGRQIGSALYTAADEISQPFQLAHPPAVPAIAATHPGHAGTLIPAIIALVWFCGFMTVLALWSTRWRRTARIAQDASPVYAGRELEALRRAERNAGMRSPIPLRLSIRALEPGIFGIFRPVLLWPAGISEHMNDAQIEAIAAHEVEHVRRRDNLGAAAHMLVEALFWFYPAVRWLGARLVEERERACDEKVIEQNAKPEAYAESILKVCAFCLEPPAPCVAGVSGSDLKERVLRIMTHRSRVSLSLARKLALCSLATLAVVGPIGFGVLHAMQAPAQLIHQAEENAPVFDVATIKPSHETRPGLMIHMSPDGFASEHASLKELIKFAYGIKSDEQLVGVPDWANSEFYDIQAKESEADVNASKSLGMDQHRIRLRRMVQSLLADRFALKGTIETRELPAYALVVAKGGMKMKQVQVDPLPPVSLPPPPSSHLPRLMITGAHQVTATAWQMDEFTNWLSRLEEVGNRVVVNETGLKGNYDFVLNGIAPAPIELPDKTSDEPTTSIFAALPEQLGLKLESRKAPVEVLVIENAARPTPN